jgi:hypothetical protein
MCALLAAIAIAGGAAAFAQQAPARGGAGRGAAPAAGSAAPRAHGNMLQLMRGILFPASNVVFAAQDDPATVKPAEDPSTSPNPLSSAYGQWQAVENAGIALAESANLLTFPRACSNGIQAPVNNADWQKFVQGLRDAGMIAYKAGQSKNIDQVLEAGDAMATACANCHDVYREKTPQQGGIKARCTAS